ncbi:PAS domain-containing sensor histidine kinase [Pontibacter sp. KCTC 32443]|uniref:sensor histidine kinase n=1 Tax=Pontibacter TaxID=323449 RepID=UPI00164CDF4F|nr:MULTISPECIES: PAS domain-containing sensor histidine kinase [Pontibacter]MBC5772515.1 PAS domain-containing sensor histidine kinase [Pontibacter sp. KCTC 32443]
MSNIKDPVPDANRAVSRKEKRDFNNEEIYRLIIEGVKDYAIFMLDTTGKIVTWNAGAEHIKGYKADEIIGKHFSIFYPREALERNFPQFELTKAKADGKFEDEGWRVRKDGSLIWANVVITALYNKQGKHIGFSKVTRDLSERKKNEDLMFKNQELLRINKDLDNFIYTASHDLKAPVINLEGLVEVLKEEIGDNKHEAVLSRITHSINRLKNVITDLSDIARLQESGTTKEPVPLQELFDEVKEDLDISIGRTGAKITSDLGDYTLLRYPRKNLRSVLYNLLSNAIKYASPERTPEVHISIEQPSPNLLVLRVADNGLGMNEVQLQKIFQMYRRMHTHVEGSGLGLYIVKRILENQGDSIEVQSEEGKGTTFTIFFRTGEL